MVYQIDNYQCCETFIPSFKTNHFIQSLFLTMVPSDMMQLRIENSPIRKKSLCHLKCSIVHRMFSRHVLITILKSAIDILNYHIL